MKKIMNGKIVEALGGNLGVIFVYKKIGRNAIALVGYENTGIGEKQAKKLVEFLTETDSLMVDADERATFYCEVE